MLERFQLMLEGPFPDPPREAPDAQGEAPLPAAGPETALERALRWNAAHAEGDRAAATADLAAARAAYAIALRIAEGLLEEHPTAGLPLFALSTQRLAGLSRELGDRREAFALAWRWLERVLGAIESSKLPTPQRLELLESLDEPVRQVLTDLTARGEAVGEDPKPRARAMLARLRRASDAVARAQRGEPPLS